MLSCASSQSEKSLPLASVLSWMPAMKMRPFFSRRTCSVGESTSSRCSRSCQFHSDDQDISVSTVSKVSPGRPAASWIWKPRRERCGRNPCQWVSMRLMVTVRPTACEMPRSISSRKFSMLGITE